MDELEKYECFAVPPHLGSADAVAASPVRAATPRPAALPEGTFLGIEAFPSPALADLLPAIP
jgi:hypothetical protein